MEVDTIRRGRKEEKEDKGEADRVSSERKEEKGKKWR